MLDISLSEYASKNYSTTSQDNNCTAMAFSADGTKLYVAGFQNGTMYQYTLSTAWDISTASYASKSLALAGYAREVRSITFSSDGTKMNYANRYNQVYEYTLSTAWDITTGTYIGVKTFTSQDSAPMGHTFNGDGTKLYMVGDTNDTIYQYSFSSAYVVSTMTYASKSFDFSDETTNAYSVQILSDGKTMLLSDTDGMIYQYKLSTAWDISTAVYSNKSYEATELTTPNALVFVGAEEKFYYMDNDDDTIYQYTAISPKGFNATKLLMLN